MKKFRYLIPDSVDIPVFILKTRSTHSPGFSARNLTRVHSEGIITQD